MTSNGLQDELFRQIVERLNVPRGSYEDMELWKSRVVYSAIGALASTCLWNFDELTPEFDIYQSRSGGQKTESTLDFERGKGVSVVYWERFVKNLWRSYCSIYPETKPYFPSDHDALGFERPETALSSEETRPNEENVGGDSKQTWNALIDETLDLFLFTGCLYHKRYWLAPVPYKSARIGSILLERGVLPDVSSYRSGLGAWKPASPDDTSPQEGVEKLGLQSDGFHDEYLRVVEVFRRGSRNEEPENAFYLRTESGGSRRWGEYWVDRPTADGEISLGRFGNRGSERYFLYRFRNGAGEYSYLNEWRVNPSWLRPKSGSREYMRLANAILYERGVLPRTVAYLDESLVVVELGYLLPPIEHSFFKLYSWPTRGFRDAENFCRAMTREVYNAFKEYFIRLGIQVDERSINEYKQNR